VKCGTKQAHNKTQDDHKKRRNKYSIMDSYPAAEPIPDIASYHAELSEFLVDNVEMKKAAKHSLRQGLYAGGGAVAGGMIGGPVGGLIGGVIGSLVGYFQSDDYNGVVQQVMVLPEERQVRLIKGVRQILATAGATTNLRTVQGFRQGLIEMAARPSVREQVWRACLDAVDSTN